jgi:hypothetical protein
VHKKDARHQEWRLGSLSAYSGRWLHGYHCCNRECQSQQLIGNSDIHNSQNIDSRPPTLLRQFMLQQFPPSTLPSMPSHLCLLPSPDRTSLTLVTSPPLASFNLCPSAFFDGQRDGLNICVQSLPRVIEEESKIIKLVRTPAGRGIGVVRSCGGEAWRVLDKSSRLQRTGRWPPADLVVVLDGGLYLHERFIECLLTLSTHRAAVCNVLQLQQYLDLALDSFVHPFFAVNEGFILASVSSSP